MPSSREKIAAVAIPLIGLGGCIAATIGQKILEGGVTGDFNQDSLIYGGVGVAGGVTVNLLSNTAQTLFGRLSASLVTKHPDQLNNDIQKALSKASTHALKNLLILYKEEKPPKADFKKAKDFVDAIQDEVGNLFSQPAALTGYDRHLEEFIHAPVEDAKNQITKSLNVALGNADIPASFIKLFEEDFVDQLKLCFTKQLKTNSNAWVAFQKTMLEGLKGDLTQLLEINKSLEAGMTEIKEFRFGNKNIRINKKNVIAIEKLLSDLRKDADSFKAPLEAALNGIKAEIIEELRRNYKISEEILRKLERLKVDSWSRKMVISSSLLACSITATCFMLYYYYTQTFMITIKVFDPEDADNTVLRNSGKVSINYGNKAEEQNINENGEVHFFQIPGQYRNDSTTIVISQLGGEPYRQLNPSKKFKLLPASRYEVPLQTHGLDKLSGVIYDENSLPIAGATVRMNGLEITTNDNGEFLFVIPREKQRRFQNLTVVKNGYKPAGLDSVSPHTQTTGLEIVLYR